MAKKLLNILVAGDPVLRKVAEPVTRIDKKLHRLLKDMADTMYASDGVGLAAPQIGVSKRIVVIDVGEGLFELINPVIVKKEGEVVSAEGCLSVPGRRGMVKRPMKVRARFQDRNGEWYEIEGEELLARCIMHETDHLDGKMYVDVMSREIFDDEEETEENE